MNAKIKRQHGTVTLCCSDGKVFQMCESCGFSESQTADSTLKSSALSRTYLVHLQSVVNIPLTSLSPQMFLYTKMPDRDGRLESSRICSTGSLQKFTSGQKSQTSKTVLKCSTRIQKAI